jgi:hypothetical protein
MQFFLLIINKQIYVQKIIDEIKAKHGLRITSLSSLMCEIFIMRTSATSFHNQENKKGGEVAILWR